MEQILDAPVDLERKITTAGFWIRVGASFVDTIILLAVNTVISFAFFGAFTAIEADPEAALLAGAINLIFNVVYFCGFESSSRQATLGKMAVGIKVGNYNGERISFANALGRYFAKILSALTLYIGFMMAGWDSRNQALHDKLANTYVFYK